MKKTTVHNLIIVDASGSMCLIYDQALIGINQTIKTVKELQQGDATIDQHITLLSFADGLDEPEYIYDGKQIDEVKDISKKEYKLRGNTALYDAIGKSVSKLRESMADGDKALVTIITDGQENDSRTWDETMVKDLIEELKDKGWVFTYIGANQDVNRESSRIGIKNHLRFESTHSSTMEMFDRERIARRNWNMRLRRGEANLEEDYFTDQDPDSESQNRVTPDIIATLAPNEIFVFGSNIDGFHCGGAAKFAMLRFGAKYGEGDGPQGQSYAIPTVDCSYRHTKTSIQNFIAYAKDHPHLQFLVTEVGCGNAGWDVADMAPLFADAKEVKNISLPKKFWQYL